MSDPMPKAIRDAKARLKQLGFNESGPQIVFDTKSGKRVAVAIDTRSPENDSGSEDSVRQQIRIETIRKGAQVKLIGRDLYEGAKVVLFLIQYACPERGWGSPTGVTDQPETLNGWRDRMTEVTDPDETAWLVNRFTAWTIANPEAVRSSS